MRTWSLLLLGQFLHLAVSALHVLAAAASAALKFRATLQLENLALRHQLGVLRRSVKRPKLTSADRFLWARLCEVWLDWRSALVIVKPETVISGHRKGFRLFWTLCIPQIRSAAGETTRNATNQIFRSAFRQEQLDGHENSTGEIGDQDEVSLVPDKQAPARRMVKISSRSGVVSKQAAEAFAAVDAFAIRCRRRIREE